MTMSLRYAVVYVLATAGLKWQNRPKTCIDSHMRATLAWSLSRDDVAVAYILQWLGHI